MLYNFLTIQLILKAKVQTLVNNNMVQPIQRVSNLFQHNTKLLTQFNNKPKLQLINQHCTYLISLNLHLGQDTTSSTKKTGSCPLQTSPVSRNTFSKRHSLKVHVSNNFRRLRTSQPWPIHSTHPGTTMYHQTKVTLLV